MGRHSVPVFHGLEFLQDVIKTTEFMLAGINALWARLTLILARTVRRGLKLALRRAKIIILMPKNTICITMITLEGIDKIKAEKKEMTYNKTI